MLTERIQQAVYYSKLENPQKLTQLSPRSHPRHLVGKRITQKEVIKNITSENQVNSYFPHRWSPSSLTFNIYFHLFLYEYILRIMINNGTPHLKITTEPNQNSCLGTASNKITGGGGGGGLQLVCSRPTLDFSSALVP